MGKTTVFYFSGTGNSLFAAMELERILPDATLSPMVSYVEKGAVGSTTETVGFVFPVYFATVPNPVKNFIKKLDLSATKYLFAIATRGGTAHRAFTDIDKVLNNRGKKLGAALNLNMADNNPRFPDYHVVTREEIAVMESEVKKKILQIHKVILNKETSRKPDTDFISPISTFLLKSIPLMLGITELFGLEDSYESDSGCLGCGTCERVCLTNKIRMKDQKPLWLKQEKCFSCRACLNYCPQNAIQIKSTRFMKSHTAENGRYPHPFATVEEIAAQKYKYDRETIPFG
jgi:ferredoxin